MKLGSATSCGIAGATTYCWGTNFYGSTGDGSTTGPVILEPTALVGAPAFAGVYPGGGNDIFTPVCALTGGGAAYCWGANHSGELGTTATTVTCSLSQTETFGCSGTPLAVSGSYTYKVLTVGAEHVCGITSTGQVACWGRDDLGQLGGATTDSTSSAPLLVPGVEGP
jgi:alpha-tubulin suppressor-like RCC1 family protein